MLLEKVEHHPEKNCFTLPTEGKEATLEYRLVGAASEAEATGVNFTHTYVPPELRGRGLAEALVRRGLKWARERNYRIEATCWYVAKFLR